MDKKYTVISIQLDNKYPEKQSVIYFTSHYQRRRYSSLQVASTPTSLIFSFTELAQYGLKAAAQAHLTLIL